MAAHRIHVLLLATALAAGGCGGGDEEAAAPAATRTAEPTPTPTPTEAPPKRARSAQACLELWNADELRGSTHQVSASDFLEDLAREGRRRVAVDYQKPDCWVMVPIGPRRLMTFVAPGGQGFYHNPERLRLKPRQYVRINARARPDGRLAPAG